VSTLLLLSGVPASGKSYFGNWLEQERGFLHLDIEKDGRLQQINLQQSWSTCFQTRECDDFVVRLKELGRPVVQNWGFPTAYLHVIESLRESGVDVWWFDADHSVARRSFLRRDDISVQAFDKQVTDIARDWHHIRSVFGRNILKTLQDDGTYLSPNEICDHIFTKTT